MALSVTVSPTPVTGYIWTSFSIYVSVSPWSGIAPCDFNIYYGDGTSDYQQVFGNAATFQHQYLDGGSYTIRADVTDLGTGEKGTAYYATVQVSLPPKAPAYERVHYIGHAVYNEAITVDLMRQYGRRIEIDLMEETGYQVFLKGIYVRHFPPFLTDVDFIFDVPYVPASPITGIEVIWFLSILWKVLLAIAALAFIGWLYWTSYIEKEKIYVCDQDPEPLTFQGEQAYRAHLASAHPEKYETYKEEQPWWEKVQWQQLISMLPWIVGGVVLLEIIRFIRGK